MYHWQRLPVRWWIHVHLDGRTDQVLNYVHKEQRAPTPKRYGGCMYSTKRTKKRFTVCGKVHALLGRTGRAYFVTHTMPPSYDNKQRREHHRRWLDRLRKEPGYRGHQWVTERHDGSGTRPELRGLIHHHAVVRFASAWNWRSQVQQWSKRYSGSNNGLDIQEVRSHLVGAYMGKALGYMSKATGGHDELPFRWWGTSRIVRTVRMRAEDAPIYKVPEWHKGRPAGWQSCAHVEDHMALTACARATELRELRKAHRLRLRGKYTKVSKGIPTVVNIRQ